MLWNRFDADKNELNPYDNDFFLAGEGLSARDAIVSAVQKNDEHYREEPQNIRQAYALDYYFTKTRLVFNPRNWFGFAAAGWVSMKDTNVEEEKIESRVGFAEAGWVNTPKRNKVLPEAIRSPAYKRVTAGRNEDKLQNDLMRRGLIFSQIDCYHSTPDWNILLAYGFSGLKDRARQYRKEKQLNGTLFPKAEKFYQGIDIAYAAVLTLLDRYIKHISSILDKDEKLPLMREALCNLAVNPPRNFYEALLFSYLYHWTCEFGEGIQVRTLGNMDDIFRPYYEKDLREGSLTREQAKELLKYYFYTFDCQATYYGQPASLGGTLLNGETAVNELTYLMLEAYDECSIESPKLQMLVGKNTPDKFVKTCLEMCRRSHTSMVFMNEDLGKRIFENFADRADVEKTRVGSSGCYNFTYADLFNYPSHTRINLPKLLDSVFEDEIALSNIKTFDGFYKAYLEKYDELVEQCVVISDWFDSIADSINPANIFSGTVTTALEKAEDMFMSGAKYNDTIIIIACPATVFDSMIMVKKYVFDKKVISLGELKKALDADWAGYENLRRTILLDHDKWGNNIGWVDDIAVSLYTYLVRTINANKNKRGGNYITYGETIDFDIRFAPKVKATPDGRKAGEILSKGLVANNGQDRSGITALINSVTKLPSLEMAAGAPFDYMIHPSMIQGEEGLEAITGMLRTFFAQGGYSFMGNIIDVETMLKAQREPEGYKNLQVRLCGWNVHFNDLMKLQQDQLIKQAASS